MSESVKRVPARLLDIDVDEVSLVDRAANKHKFVVIKNENGGEDMAIERQKKSAGPEEKVEKAQEETKVEEATTESTPEAATETEKTPDKDAVVEGVEKGLDAKALTGAIEKLTVSMNDLLQMIPAAKTSDAAEAQQTEEKVEETKETPEPVEKAGAKISQKRLEKIKSAHTTLTTLLEDLGVADKIEAEQGVEKAEKPDVDMTKFTEKIGEVLTEVKKLADKVEAIEGEATGSTQPGDNTTEESVEKGDKSVWGDTI